MSFLKTVGVGLFSNRLGLKTLRCKQEVSILKRYISKKKYQWPEFREEDLEEEFMRGSGPGGQSVAKTNNCVQIKHLPTGIVVKSHESRSQSENRKFAREKLAYQLDIFYNKENSFHAISQREAEQSKKVAKGKARKRLELKREFKERKDQETKEGEGFDNQSE
ncbi:mitochondrial translation release factor in rescue-like [Ruditapes philippinarum]|uniref:mitochondrial translation release factor in rescue-like n=1 Tax=Ruditapes philippinarum TaxID=129788 RepID=UPI00295A6AB5|nr:mitochondrial translation release factor in rescue-like [Ruditapes philippinarum]